jgi:hypothetical protein
MSMNRPFFTSTFTIVNEGMKVTPPNGDRGRDGKPSPFPSLLASVVGSSLPINHLGAKVRKKESALKVEAVKVTKVRDLTFGR